jgi:Tfp pilus assembly protein FimV
LEREAEIVRLHQAMKDLEMRQHAAMQTKMSDTTEEIAGLKLQLSEKDALLQATANNLAAVVGAVNAVNYAVEAVTLPFTGTPYVAPASDAAEATEDGDEDY